MERMWARGVDGQRLVLGDLLGGPAAGEREEHLTFARRKSRSVRHGLASLHVAARLARVGVRLTRSQRKLLVCRKSVVYRWEKPIKPGTDLAMMLGWMHYIIENGLYEKIPGYEDFCEQWTNLPFLVDPRDEVSLPPVAEDITADGMLLRASQVFEDVDETNEGYIYFDTETGQVTKAFALGPDNDGTYHPQLFGTVDVTLKDGSTITCKTAFQAYKDRCADYDLDTVAAITGCDAGKIAEAMSDPESDLYDPNMEACMDAEKIASPMVSPYWKTINEYWDYVAQQCGDSRITTMEEARAIMPEEWATDDEYWGGTTYDGYKLVNAGGGAGGPKGDMGPSAEAADPNAPQLYTGFSTAAKDIKDNPKKCGPYADQMLYIGRHGNESFEMPASVVDWNPMPYYFTPEDETQFGDDYPLTLTEGRIPYFHHGTLRNNPYLRELYPAPEVWISPENASELGIVDGDWVNVHSPRTDGLDVFRDITTGVDKATTLAGGKDQGPSEFVPGEELTADAQSIVAEGIYGVARVTEGIARDSVYMERFWNPEFLEDGSDGRKSWTLENMNVLTKNTGFYNPEFGTYTLRGIRVRIEKSERPEGVWYEPEDFEPWMPEPSDFTGGAYYE